MIFPDLNEQEVKTQHIYLSSFIMDEYKTKLRVDGIYYSSIYTLYICLNQIVEYNEKYIDMILSKDSNTKILGYRLLVRENFDEKISEKLIKSINLILKYQTHDSSWISKKNY